MKSNPTASSLSVLLTGTVVAGSLLTMPLLPKQAIASPASATASSSEWQTTQSGEQKTPPLATNQKPSPVRAKANGSEAKRTVGGSDQKPRASKKTRKPKSFGDEVEQTFLGIGGDLEEFFTGKRTVDK